MENGIAREKISEFYGTFCEEEKNLRLNLRHYSVFYHLVKAGLHSNHHVLEIGCGFGTITSLMAKYLGKGSIVATDISKERIASCTRNFAGYKNCKFVLSDMTDFNHQGKFDFIVLPDVLEHIPEEAHDNLFALMAGYLNENGRIAIHLPHPTALDYVRENSPELLQIIDQSISSDRLLQNAYTHGLRLDKLVSYGLGRVEHDYQMIVFVKNLPYQQMSNRPTNAIRWEKLKRQMFFWRKRIFG